MIRTTSQELTRRSFVSSLAGTAVLLNGQGIGQAAETSSKETLVAFGAHPADVMGSCGATLLKHALRGDKAVAVPLTLGVGHLWKPKEGSFGRLKDESTAQLKTLEQANRFYTDVVQKAYAALSPVELHLLGLADSPLELSTKNIKAVVEVIRRFQPTMVLTHHPTMSLLAGHPDHRDAGELVLRAIMLAMEETFHTSPYPTAVVSRIICYGGSGDRWQSLGQADAPNVFVDVSDTATAKDKASLIHGPLFGVTADSLKQRWSRSSQPGHPHLEAFVQLRPVVVDYLRSSPGRPWLGANLLEGKAERSKA
ncbi:MAG: hypothetical protein FJW26_05925 [Acidimicrobiia bacterium]|nr:hypothetical protein [Acidimicrobiia bacterium]